MSISINTQFIYHLISYHLGPIVQSTSTTSPHLSTTSGLGICNLRCWANEKKQLQDPWLSEMFGPKERVNLISEII